MAMAACAAVAAYSKQPVAQADNWRVKLLLSKQRHGAHTQIRQLQVGQLPGVLLELLGERYYPGMPHNQLI